PFDIAAAVRNGELAGTVVDARTGDPVNGASVVLTSAMGQEVASAGTAGSGNFSITDIPAGEYTLSITASGYAISTQPVTIVADDVTTVSIALSSSQAAGTVSIVLTWGADPRDLDSHLFLHGGSQIYYANMGDCSLARLDRDDTDGFGAEAMPIVQTASGVYMYVVYICSGRVPSRRSATRVQAYVGDNLVRTFDAPSGMTGENRESWWTVFRLRNGTIEEVNTLGSAAEVASDGQGLRAPLPPKRGGR